MHEILIAFVIIIIVAAQGMVGYTAWKKIDEYKQIIPEPQNFETVKVYVPESQIKKINIDYILNNLNKFQLPQKDKEQFVEAEIIVNTETTVAEVKFKEEAGEPGYDDLIWITKGNEEKKIKYRLLTSHLQDGWSRL
jgi:hypothetical protein